jgi:hypothetical protein
MRWHGLTRGNVLKYVAKDKLVFATTGTKLYAGRVNEVTDTYVELQNGNDRQYLYHAQRAIKFTVLDVPPGFDLRMGDPELGLD